MSFTVTNIKKNSIGEEAGIAIGDRLLTINGEPLIDCIDYLYFEAMEQLEIEVEKKNGERFVVDIDKDSEESLGIEYSGDDIDRKRHCCNKCMFCFVDQLPRNMRKTLYFKDDDWRFSFIMGNYITLTNVTDEEFDRILRRKVSPLYISVHATNDKVRTALLGQKKPADVLPRLKLLKENGITFECQAVLVEGINDGPILEQTLGDLEKLYPFAHSLALVPVGLTRFREGLSPISPYSKEGARKVVDIVEKWQKQFLEKYGRRFVFASDEFYIRAGEEMPSFEEYEDFAQIEDGVGLIRSFMTEAEEALEGETEDSAYHEVSIATGLDAAPYIRRIAELCEKKLRMKIRVYPIRNEFFGESITVSGLLTGKDLMKQLKGKNLGEKLFFSRSLLKEGGERIFLDDVTIDELCDILKVPCCTVENDGYSFVDAMQGSIE